MNKYYYFTDTLEGKKIKFDLSKISVLRQGDNYTNIQVEGVIHSVKELFDVVNKIHNDYLKEQENE